MLPQLRAALIAFALLTLLTGVVYPLAVTAIAQGIFAEQANGSLIVDGDRIVGSQLIGQPFDVPRYFWSRPSATGPTAYHAGASSGSNLGPTNPALLDAVEERLKKLREADPANEAPVPVDLITASASGLDPHITPAAADYQVARLARLRGLPPERIQQLIREHVEGRTFGILGEPRVNVLLLNRALDRLKE